MKNYRKFLIILILSFLFINCFSQRYNLKECIDLAINNNNKIKIASAEEKIAYYEKIDAITKYFPELSLNANYLRNEKQINLIPNKISIDKIFDGNNSILPPDINIPEKIRKLGRLDIRYIWNISISAKQPIFTGGKISAFNDIKNYSQDLSKIKKDTEYENIIVEAQEAYWQIASLSGKKKIATSYVKSLQKMKSDVTNMEKEGMSTKSDKLAISVKLNEAEVMETKAENGLKLAKMYLSSICGLDISKNINIADEDFNIKDLKPEKIQLPNIELAIEDRKEIKSLNLAKNIYKKNETIAFSEFLPQVGLFASYMWISPNLFNGFNKKLEGFWTIGISASISLNPISNNAKYQSAKMETFIANYKLNEAKDQIKMQIHQSAYKLNEANKKLISAQTNMKNAEENLRVANIGFKEGVINSTVTLNAQTAWLSAISELLDAQIDVKLCKVYLDRSLGLINYDNK